MSDENVRAIQRFVHWQHALTQLQVSKTAIAATTPRPWQRGREFEPYEPILLAVNTPSVINAPISVL
ncbi:MAG: hypothetical protein M1493_09135 [Firmicutes bacterium]|jgi:hypothetical protein|uniref:Uncharacterized protein n=1 Tax=Sulfobacillus benefaciens TaxID=453960 RepID=A0A2T2WZY9_9FIRM|nr:hypothetical protein [Bacillota bacterium]PSR27792.1 MAG: hypothetical protein C7B43_11405 [Sulfobacillus benefaciens]